MKAVKTLCALETAGNYQEALIVLSNDKSITDGQRKRLLRAATRADKARVVINEILAS